MEKNWTSTILLKIGKLKISLFLFVFGKLVFVNEWNLGV